MRHVFRYGMLRKDISDEAESVNAEWLGPNTLGIEVTTDSLAAQCGLGNNDPQHQGLGSSAIEESLTWPLPPAGSKLVTIRPDKDSIGAMAIFGLRAMGRSNEINKTLVSWVGAIDRHGFADACQLCPDLAKLHPDNSVTNALNVICLGNIPYSTMEDKVFHTARLLCGEMTPSEIDWLNTHRKRERMEFDVELEGGVAFVQVYDAFDRARDWANHYHNVAVIFDPSHQSHGGRIKKWSIIRKPGHLDRMGCEEAINAAEAKARGISSADLKAQGLAWGGPSNIISSPKGVGRESKLDREAILKIVRSHLSVPMCI